MATTKFTLVAGIPRSGRTTAALTKVAASKYVYVASQRMLAQQVLRSVPSNKRAILSTGEEGPTNTSEFHDVDVVCCTPESTPVSSPWPGSDASIIIDEAHWIHDMDRGPYITNLISFVTGYSNVVICCALESEPIIRRLVSQRADVSDIETTRLMERYNLPLLKFDDEPLTFQADTFKDEMLPMATVSFSQTSLRKVYRTITQLRPDLRVMVMWGAAQPEVRLKIFDAVQRGEVDVLVTTSLLCHGIDTRFASVIFCETRSPLPTKAAPTLLELGMIAGRADAYVAAAIGYGKCSHKVARLATEVAMGRMTPRDVHWGVAFGAPMACPPYADSWLKDLTCLPLAISTWAMEQERLFHTCGHVVYPSVRTLYDRAQHLLQMVATLPVSNGAMLRNNGGLGLHEAWVLCQMPIRSNRWHVLVCALVTGSASHLVLQAKHNVVVMNDIRIMLRHMARNNVVLHTELPTLDELDSAYRALFTPDADDSQRFRPDLQEVVSAQEAAIPHAGGSFDESL